MERWATVPGYEGRYEASDLGRFRSLQVKGNIRKEPLVMKDQPAGHKGYRVFWLFDGARYKSFYVQRLVLIVFFGPPPSAKHEAAHEDGVNTHNWLSNLSWKTTSENHMDKVRHGTHLRGERGSNAVLTERQVLECRLVYVCRSPDFGTAALARRFGVSQGHISDIVSYRRWAYDAIPHKR